MMSKMSWKRTRVEQRAGEVSAKMKSFCLKHIRVDSPGAHTVHDLDFQLLVPHDSLHKFTHHSKGIMTCTLGSV